MATFCGKCGSQLEEIIVGAEKFLSSDAQGGKAFAKYDHYTGKRNVVLAIICPKNRAWNSGHYYRAKSSVFTIDEIAEKFSNTVVLDKGLKI